MKTLAFKNREEAGVRLAARLRQHRNHAVAIALPCGGVPVATEVSRLLYVPLGVVLVHKLSLPGGTGAPIGALASGGGASVDWHRISEAGQHDLDAAVSAGQRELERRASLYVPFTRLIVSCREVILIDDGVATGASMRAAIRSIRPLHPSRIIVAVPVGHEPALRLLGEEADECICLSSSPHIAKVNEWYREFPPVSDAEALRQLECFERQHKLTAV